jgi:cytidylate kinase
VTVRVIAIDGPAASGKSSTAAAVARRLGWAHLDSGALYRAITLGVLDNLGEPEAGSEEQWSPQQIVALAEHLPVRLVLVRNVFRPEVAGVDVERALRSERVTRRVSAIAAIPPVRHWVNVRQREAVLDHPGAGGGVVVDGRDIGTVVFPDAPLKIFLTASPEERARRRLAERNQGREGGGGGGGAIDAQELAREAAALAARDLADSTRPVAPLRAAADAVRLDTTRLSLDEQVERVVALARERFPH